MRIAVCDDDTLFCDKMKMLLSEKKFYGIKSDFFYSGEALINKIEDEKICYHIYCLDIVMEGMDGITVAKKIKEKDQRALIIFISCHDEKVFDVFYVMPFQFIRKSLSENEIKVKLITAVKYLEMRKQVFSFQVEKVKHTIYADDIMYIESITRKIIIHLKDKKYECYGSFNNIQGQLNTRIFARIHKSFLVNMDYISKVGGKSITLQNGEELSMGRKYADSFKNTYSSYINFLCDDT